MQINFWTSICSHLLCNCHQHIARPEPLKNSVRLLGLRKIQLCFVELIIIIIIDCQSTCTQNVFLIQFSTLWNSIGRFHRINYSFRIHFAKIPAAQPNSSSIYCPLGPLISCLLLPGTDPYHSISRQFSLSAIKPSSIRYFRCY